MAVSRTRGRAWLVRLCLAVTLLAGIPARGEAQLLLVLQWDANFELDVKGYIACYGIDSHAYIACLDVGNQTSYQFDLPEGFNYYFVVLAYDALGLNSPFSNEISTDCCSLSLTNPGAQTGTEGDVVSLQLQVSGSSGGPLIYSATGLPPDLAIDSDTGAITGSLAFGSAGLHAVSVTVSDGTLSATETFSWSVINANRAPEVTNPGDRTDAEGTMVSLQIAASDPDGDPLTFSQTGLPPGLDIDPSTGSISGTLTYDAAGAHAVTVFASDGDRIGSASFNWMVTNANQPPTLVNPGPQSNTEKDHVDFRLEASDAERDRLRFRAVGLPPGIRIYKHSGRLYGTLRLHSAGEYKTTVFVSDGTSEVSQAFPWTVRPRENHPPVLWNPGNQISEVPDEVSLHLKARDPDGDRLTFSASGLPRGLRIDRHDGGIHGRLRKESAGHHEVTVSVSDGRLSTSQTFVWVVKPHVERRRRK